jgi:hypothetical protein
MKSAAEIRLENLEKLVQLAGSADALAKAASMSPEYISQIRNRAIDNKTGRTRNLGNQAARRLEKGMNQPIGWMDTAHGAAASGASAMAKPWPFRQIDESKVRSLNPQQLSAFEMAALIAAAQGGLDLKK